MSLHYRGANAAHSEHSVWTIQAMKNVTKNTPLLLATGLLALVSCGSTPEPETAPPEELLAEAEAEPEAPPEVQVLEDQLAQMAAALEVATAEAAEPVEPAQEEPISVADEVAGMYFDPGEAFPVELVDGVPAQTAMVVTDEAEEAPEEIASEPVVEFAQGMESLDGELGEVEPPLEITEADLAAMTESMPDMAFEDPGFIEPTLEVTEDSVASDEEAVADAVDSEVAVAVDGEVTDAVDGETLAVADATDEVPDATELADATDQLAEGLDQLAQAEVPVDQDPALTADAVQAAIAESIASALEDTSQEESVVETPEQPEGEVELAVVEGPPAIEWRPAEEAALVAVVVEDEQPAVVDSIEADVSQEPVDEVVAGAESLVIETVEESPTATAMNTAAANSLSDVFAFTSDLDPSTRLILGPLCLADPSGMLARTSVGFIDLANVYSDLTASPPEDPAVAGLTHSSGAEFNPISIEEAELTEEPGLGMIWWGDEVPEKQVAAKMEVQTPSVGRVRLVLTSGDYVEGTLHSVGQDQYWVDGDLGRFAVRSGLVSHVEHLPKPGLGQEVSGLQAGDLVRAKAKNGYIEGRLISMKDGDALIETAAGMRITLPNATVEPLGKSKTRVVID